MTTLSTIKYSVLALDTYNRGYTAGLVDPVSGLPFSILPGAEFAGLELLGTSTDLLGQGVAQAADFFATAFMTDDEIVISFRGTDSAQDFNDWSGMAAGIISEQVNLAIEFYQAVAGLAEATGKSIVMTGHSLGGALAGVVGSLYGLDTVMFDNVAYDWVVDNIYEIAADPQDAGGLALREAVYGSATPWEPDRSNLRTHALENDIAGVFRNFQSAPIDTTYLTTGFEPVLSALDAHSMSALTIALFMDAPAIPWDAAAKFIMPALLSNEVADRVGIEAIEGNPANAVMRDMIAYTTIGESGFGDAAVAMLRDDAMDLDTFLRLNPIDGQWIAEGIVGYAALLAQNVKSGSAYESGFLTFDAPGSPDVLTIDLGDEVWNLGEGSEEVVLALREQLVTAPLDGIDPSAALFFAHQGLAEVIDIVSLTSEEASALVLTTEEGYGLTMLVGSADSDDITGGVGNEVIIAGPPLLDGAVAHGDVLRGGGGSDFIIGSGGNDMMSEASLAWGGAGNDSFSHVQIASGGSGYDTFANFAWASGGSGNDTFILDGGYDHLAWGGTGGDAFEFGEGTFTVLYLLDDETLSEMDFLNWNGASAFDLTHTDVGLNIDEFDYLKIGSEVLDINAYWVSDGVYQYDLDGNTMERETFRLVDEEAGVELSYIAGNLQIFHTDSETNAETWISIQGFEYGDFGISWDYQGIVTTRLRDLTAGLLVSEEFAEDPTLSAGHFDVDLSQYQHPENLFRDALTPPPPEEPEDPGLLFAGNSGSALASDWLLA